MSASFLFLFFFFWCRLDLLFVCALYFFNFSNRESLWADKTIDQISNSLLPTANVCFFSLPSARKLYMSNILLALFFYLFCFCASFPPVLIVKKKKQTKKKPLCWCCFIQTRSRKVFSKKKNVSQPAMQICVHNVALLAVEKVHII